MSCLNRAMLSEDTINQVKSSLRVQIEFAEREAKCAETSFRDCYGKVAKYAEKYAKADGECPWTTNWANHYAEQGANEFARLKAAQSQLKMLQGLLAEFGK